jgi:hypothetical protein
VTNEDDSSAPPDTDIYDPNKSNMYGYYDTYRQTRFGVACQQGGSLQLTPYQSSMGPLQSCQAAPNMSAGDIGREFDISRYINFFTQSQVNGGVKTDPQDVILVGINAPTDPVQVILADPNTGNGKMPKPQYVECGALSPPGCVVRLAHSCQNNVDPAFFGDPPIRLNTVINSVPDTQRQVANICGDDLNKEPDYTQALQKLAGLISSSIGQGCIPAPLTGVTIANGMISGNPDCVVQDVTLLQNGMTQINQIPRCDTVGNALPCWKVEIKAPCAKSSPQSAGVTVVRDPANPAPPNTNARVECNTIASGGTPSGGAGG